MDVVTVMVISVMVVWCIKFLNPQMSWTPTPSAFVASAHQVHNYANKAHKAQSTKHKAHKAHTTHTQSTHNAHTTHTQIVIRTMIKKYQHLVLFLVIPLLLLSLTLMCMHT